MKIKIVFLQIIASMSIISCSQNTSKMNIKYEALLIDTEIYTLYRKTENTFEVARILAKKIDSFDIELYRINTSVAGVTKQDFISVQHFMTTKLEDKKAELQKHYNWIPLKSKDILFVQIQPTAAKGDLDFLDLRQETEDKIGKALENQQLGEWIAGDLGPGGGNMLFEVTNLERSLKVVLQVLQQNGLEKNIVIGKRVNIDENDWFHEVIYPSRFTGVFNTM
jgi:hypothetical protein